VLVVNDLLRFVRGRHEIPAENKERLSDFVRKAVIFDCGESLSDMTQLFTLAQPVKYSPFVPPYDSCIFQAGNPASNSYDFSVFLLQRLHEKDYWQFFSYVRRKDTHEWHEGPPLHVYDRADIPALEIESPWNDRYDEEITKWSLKWVAMLNVLFYKMNSGEIASDPVSTSHKKNEKRARKGKLPLLEYKILRLKVGATKQPSADLGGTHASLRMHTRRGHLRRLKSGRVVAVRPAMVGSKHGFIWKDYEITSNKGTIQ
jgi:hypothetical protein